MSIDITLGGDVNFSKNRGQIPALINREKKPIWFKIFNKILKLMRYRNLSDFQSASPIDSILINEYDGIWNNGLDNYINDNPFKYIGDFFKDSHLGYINLETPISNSGRHLGAFCSNTKYLDNLKNNNIRVVSIANNHAFDGGEIGFRDTINNLNKNDIKYVGGDFNIDKARNGQIIRINDIKIGFLAYTLECNSFFISLATKNQSGILPLYKKIVMEDIKKIKKKCDFLIVAPHFDIENSCKINRSSTKIAHDIIDAGADFVIGSHAHVPKPIEVYKGKIVVYCLGNCIFPYSKKMWTNNLLGKLILTDEGKYREFRIYALYSKNKNCFQPYILKNQEAKAFLEIIKNKSKRKFNLDFEYINNYLRIVF